MKKSLLLATILGLGTTGLAFATDTAPTEEATVEKAPHEKGGEHHGMKGKRSGKHHAKKMQKKMKEMHKEETTVEGHEGAKSEDMPPMGPKEMNENK